MPFTQNLGIVSETNRITASGLNKVAAALQKQAVRDFGPIWGVEALVSPFAQLEDMPIDYWPIVIRDDIGYPGAAGIHLDQDGQPYALVQWSPEWSLTASHETVEMLGDPFGNRLIAGESPKPGQGRVSFLVEVADPSEAAQFGYTVNGILVSDFYTPRFFDPVRNSSVRYSFTGAITRPRQILRGGYLSWMVQSTREWWQGRWFSGTKPKFVNLGVLTGRGSLRSLVDAATVTPELKRSFTGESIRKLITMKESICVASGTPCSTLVEVNESSSARAARLRQQIDEVRKQRP